MSIRLAFYELGGLGSSNIDMIYTGMLKDIFKDGRQSGFLLDKGISKEISGQFVRAISRVEESTTPLGKKLSFERTIFQIQKFRIQESRPHLIVENPSYAFRAFIARLAEHSNFSVSLNQINYSTEKLINILRKKVEQLQISSLRLESFPLNPNVIAHLKLEGKGNLAQLARQFLPDRSKLKFSGAKIEFLFHGIQYSCALSDSGRVLLYGDSDSSVCELISASVGEVSS